MDWGQGDGFRTIQVDYIYWALYFYYYYISSTSDHQALDPGGWGPLLLVCMSLVFPHFPTCSSLCSAISSSMDVLGEGKRRPHRPDHQHAECGFRALGRFSRSCKISISPPLLQIWDHKTCQTASGTLDKCFESQKTKYFRSSSQKLQYFGHLIWRTDSFEKTLMLGKIEGRRRRGDGWMASLMR